MRPFILDFRERRREVRRYLVTLKMIEKRMSGQTLRRYELEAKIFRAGAILLIYNALEASARSAIEAIYDDISAKRVPFDDLRDSLRKRILADFRKNAAADAHSKMRDVAFDIVLGSFNSDKLFSGNVDARQLRLQSQDYGFSLPDSEYARTRNGSELVKVKRQRNDLAHGVKSFSDVGSQYSLREVVEIGRYCMAYMERVLYCVDEYLNSRGYVEARSA